jgi:hypothetical protein
VSVKSLVRARLAPFAFLTPLAAVATLAGAPAAHADEGMWPFDMIPRERVQKEHGVTLSDAWLDHLRLASVRFNSGGSGSFVSPTGLVLTNHHVAADCISKVASSGADLMANGFRAIDGVPEMKCPDLELNVTVAIQDVTDEVRAAKSPGMSDADANVAMKGAMSRIEKRCADASGKRCDVVTLYAGGKYALTTYEKYTDVRLVFAPERPIAFFGGDPENFTYPRFDYDLAIFRVYGADGAPIKPASFLTWNEAGPKEGDTVFVSGHPGSTGRLETVSELASDRDVLIPARLSLLRDFAAALSLYGSTGAEEKRQAGAELFHVKNSEKALTGFETGLKDPALQKKKGAEESSLQAKIAADPALAKEYGSVFADVAALKPKVASLYERYLLLDWGEESRWQPSVLLKVARELVRLPVERALPNDKRLRDYRETNFESLKLHLLSGAPVYGGVEAVLVRVWLEHVVKTLGAKDPLVATVLAGRTPARAAQEIVAESKLFDVYARKSLLDGGADAVARSTDPMIVLARAIDAESRAVKKRWDDEVEGPMRLLGAKVAQGTFAVNGTNAAPDATFTLRLSVGVVKGYDHVPWATTLGGLFAHATGTDPLRLPKRWLDAKAAVDPKTPFDFVSTNDIIGGNSGSPVVDASGALVGLIFDGNLTSLANRYVYAETTQRAVSVDTAAILEGLRKVYGEDALAKELTSGGAPAR